jgi:5-methylthioadenosine/S-adenosylhomocysteine deaminase
VTDTQARSNVDIVVTGCDIVTLDEHNTVLSDGAIAIDGGRFVWMGAAADASAYYRGNSTIDGRNRIAIPGLIDAHLHTAQQLLRGKLTEIARKRELKLPV